MKLSGWGRYPRIEVAAGSFESREELNRILHIQGDWIAHGMGRSYGDSALNKRVILSYRYNKIRGFNPEEGTVTCESGVTLAELIDVFLPKGWFLAVTPGTKFITVGGAIASDVHGKNHHTSGCFSACVKDLQLMLSDGTTITCSREENQELFFSTCGGMGLTGIILSATLTLQPVKSGMIRETVVCCRD